MVGVSVGSLLEVGWSAEQKVEEKNNKEQARNKWFS